MAENNEVLYVRNNRPNRLVFNYAGIRYRLERRGSREDTTPLPREAELNPQVRSLLTKQMLERISKDQFELLSDRLEDEIISLKQRTANEVRLPIDAPSSQTPTIIAEKDLINKEFLTPKLEYAEKLAVTGTPEELAAKNAEALKEPETPIDAQQAQINAAVEAAVAAALEKFAAAHAAQLASNTLVDDAPNQVEPKPKSTRAKKS